MYKKEDEDKRCVGQTKNSKKISWKSDVDAYLQIADAKQNPF
jgi:hypothetical protein